MKLPGHVDKIRLLIDTSFRGKLGRMGIQYNSILPIDEIPSAYKDERKKLEKIFIVLKDETRSYRNAYDKLVEELTFTLFNRLASIKVLESHSLIPEIITRKPQHGGRSFSHLLWLENNPDMRNNEQEGISQFLEDKMKELSQEMDIFKTDYPYHFLPTPIEINNILLAMNALDSDPEIETVLWKNNDVLGWMYESYNYYKREAFKESGAKTEYNKVSIQSQVYTPGWVVKFLVDNSLGKFYLEMFPNSILRNKYKIANVPIVGCREIKPVTKIRVIDPACGSGNFLLYAFDFFYDIYKDQIDNYGANYNEREIPELIIKHNLHGIDLDDRAVQLAQLGLFIKAKKKRSSVKIKYFNIVSSDFFIPEFIEIKYIFEEGEPLPVELEAIVKSLWSELQQAYKFGALLRVEEKFNSEMKKLESKSESIQLNLLAQPTREYLTDFRRVFFKLLQEGIRNYNKHHGTSFTSSKTGDAVSFLQIQTQKYDIAFANPPYTDSADFGEELKKFIESNYKKPHKFNANLYCAFIKRSYELTTESGYISMIHPFSFMFIKSFEDVRKLIIDKTHIEILVDYGLDRINLFDGGYASAPTFYVLSKKLQKYSSAFFKLIDGLQEKDKKNVLDKVFDDYLSNNVNTRLYQINQNKFKIIESWPFIYWISDDFRKHFEGSSFGKTGKIISGIKTGNNERCLRFWWELNNDSNNRWARYTKGGNFNKWYGNVWLKVNYEDNFKEIKKQKSYNIPSNQYLFKLGVTYNGLGGKGVCGRILEEDSLFDMGSSSVFFENTYYILGILNTKLVNYILNSLNPTVNTQPNDIERIPYVKPSKSIEDHVEALARENVNIKKSLCTFSLIETNYEKNPLLAFTDIDIKSRLLAYLNYENSLLALVLLNESVINQLIVKVYQLSDSDNQQIEVRLGKSVGELPVFDIARKEYLAEISPNQEIVKEHITNLSTLELEEQQISIIESELRNLYQKNNSLEEFCMRHKVNPINIWFLFKNNKFIPATRAEEIALEYIIDSLRVLLNNDENGIIPLRSYIGEKGIYERLEEYCITNGFTPAIFAQLDKYFQKPLKQYLEENFFFNFSNNLNLFMYLPKTPFIWHLSSGEYKGFEAFIIIYKWNRDSLFKLKNTYVLKRAESLQYRFDSIKDNNSGAAQAEKELIQLQLIEIEAFIRKIDELINEGYDPKLDDGVAKNIAPLQKKGMLKAEVLNKKQLEKYLNADW